jgi:hypothetical protein
VLYLVEKVLIFLPEALSQRWQYHRSAYLEKSSVFIVLQNGGSKLCCRAYAARSQIILVVTYLFVIKMFIISKGLSHEKVDEIRSWVISLSSN